VLDIVITGARVVDGNGRPAFEGGVGTSGDRIAWVGRDGEAVPEALRTIDAAGLVVAPGFVDVHNHSDLAPFVEPWMESALRMGSTTLVVGNCGSSPWPSAGRQELAALTGVAPGSIPGGWTSFGEYLDAIDAARPAVNVAALVGHGAIRMEVMGTDRRAPAPDELAAMRGFAAAAMDAGALGLSAGLIYVPGMYAATEEIVAIAAEVAARDGIYASHIRGEGEHLFRAVDEAIEIGRRAGLPSHVSHLKCESRSVWGRADDLLARFHGSDDVTADQYPYEAWASSLASFLPAWAPVATLGEILRTDRARLVRAVEESESGFQSSVKGVGWDRIVIESSLVTDAVGKSLEEVAADRGVDPIEACFRMLIEDPDTSCIGHAMSEHDVRRILADPEVFVASDASAMSPGGPLGGFPVHPRNYGTFPRVLGRYVREGVLGLEAAVQKMTSLPADRFGLEGRGRITGGAFADLVAFDPARVADLAEFGTPHRFPAGLDLVIVNGRVGWEGELRERAGRALRRSSEPAVGFEPTT
jgi:N-acyl-D-amino-acid deacylase